MVLRWMANCRWVGLCLLALILSSLCWRKAIFLWNIYGEKIPSYSHSVSDLVNRLDSHSRLDLALLKQALNDDSSVLRLARLYATPEIDDLFDQYCHEVPTRFSREKLRSGDYVEVYELPAVQDLHGSLWMHCGADGQVKDYELLYTERELLRED